jgi:hypothetical protein
LYTEAKFGHLEKIIKTIDIIRDEIIRKNSRVHAFGQQKEMKSIWAI